MALNAPPPGSVSDGDAEVRTKCFFLFSGKGGSFVRAKSFKEFYIFMQLHDEKLKLATVWKKPGPKIKMT